MMQFIDENDKLFVIQVAKNCGGKGFTKKRLRMVAHKFDIR